MNRIRGLLMTVAAALLAAACSSVGYVPQSADVPLISHEGDVRVAGYLGSNGALGFTASAGLTDHIAAQLHVGSAITQNALDYQHVAVGYYLSSNHFGLEAYAGMAHGFTDNYDRGTDVSEWTRFLKGSYLMPFAQVDAGMKDLGRYQIAFGVALKGGLMLPKMTERRVDEAGNVTDCRSYGRSSSDFIFEPQAFVRFGNERLKWNVHAGWTTSSTFADPHFLLSTGVTFCFGD